MLNPEENSDRLVVDQLVELLSMVQTGNSKLIILNDMTLVDIKKYCEILTQFPKINDIRIWNSAAVLSLWINELAKNKNILRLKIFLSNDSPEDELEKLSTTLFTTFAEHPSLKSLSYFNTKFIQPPPNLKSLKLSRRRILSAHTTSTQEFLAKMTALSEHKNLERLLLKDMEITDDELVSLLNAISKTKIEYLDLSNNQLTITSCKLLANFLQHQPKLLNTLSLTSNQLGNIGVRILINNLSDTFIRINLEDTGITDEIVPELLLLLTKNSYLKLFLAFDELSKLSPARCFEDYEEHDIVKEEPKRYKSTIKDDNLIDAIHTLSELNENRYKTFCVTQALNSARTLTFFRLSKTSTKTEISDAFDKTLLHVSNRR